MDFSRKYNLTLFSVFLVTVIMLSYYQQVEQLLFYLVVVIMPNLSIRIEVPLRIKREKLTLKTTHHQLINPQELQQQHLHQHLQRLFQPIKEKQTNQHEIIQLQTINNHLHCHHLYHHHQIVVFVTYLTLNQVYRFIHLC